MRRRSIAISILILPLIAALLGLASTAFIYRRLEENQRAQLEERFRFDASQRVEILHDAFAPLVDEVESIGRFFEESAAVDRGGFQRFAGSWASSDHFAAILWAAPSGGGRSASKGLLELEPLYAIPAIMPPADSRELLAASGVSAAALSAMSNGRLTASVIFALPRNGGRVSAVLCKPVFGASDEWGIRRFGVVMGIINIDSVAESAIAATLPSGLPIEIRDVNAEPGAPFYSHYPRLGEPLAAGHRLSSLEYTKNYSFADRTWSMTVRPSSSYAAGNDRSAFYFAAMGTIASLAVSSLVFFLLREKAKAEAASAEKSEEFERFFTTSIDLFAIAGIDGVFKRLNKQWSSTLGYSIEDLEGSSFMDYVHPDDKAATLRTVDTLENGGEVVNFVNRYRTKEGSYRNIEWRSAIASGGKMIFAAARDITERIAIEEAMRRSIVEKEALIREVHHRVKNNMQIISSLLDLEAMKADDPRFAAAAKEAQGRIRSMAMVHEQLYRQDSVSAIDLGGYIRELAARISDEYSAGPVAVSIEADTVMLDLDSAIPCGLAINELLTNAFKYACAGRDAFISVTAALGSGLCAILVEDDGPGLPDGALERSIEGSTLGLGLVSGLAEQLHGKLCILPGKGARFEIRFPYPVEKLGARGFTNLV